MYKVVCQKRYNSQLLVLRVIFFERIFNQLMNQATNLPNLGKQVKKFIGKVTRENKEAQKRFMVKGYDPRIVYQMIFKGSLLIITTDVHEAFMELLRKFKLVFNAEKVEYDIDQVAFKLEGLNHKSSQVLELSQHIIQEDATYKVSNKNGHFLNKQYSGVLEGVWSSSTGVMTDTRPKVNLDFDDRWVSKIPLIIDESKELSPLQRQCARAIDWIGDGIVNSNQTKQFLQIIISLETVIERDPKKLKRNLEKDSLWKNFLSVSIEDQLVSIIDLLCYHGLPQQQITKNNKKIKNAYSLRLQITHDGKQLKKGDSTHLLNRWYDIAYTIISNIIFSGRWDNVYDLWKAANLEL